MEQSRKNNSGFTLVEIIVTLIIAGVLAAIAGMGIVQASKAFIFTKEATGMAQKAQLAMDRTRRALENITAILSASSSQVQIQRLRGEELITETYGWAGAGQPLVVTSSEGGAGSNTLADNVSSFSLAYKKADNTDWTSAEPVEDLARIEMSLVMSGPGGTTLTYANHVVPRNTYMPDVERRYYPSGTTISGGPTCFVAAAAFDSAVHSPWGALAAVVFFWVLARILLAARKDRRKALQAATGAILLGLVIIMTIMAALGAGMVSLYSSANIASAAMPYSARAHYIAESGLRYAAWALKDNTDYDNYIRDSMHNKVFPVDDDSFNLEVLTYWYDLGVNTTPDASLETTPWGGLPESMSGIPANAAGHLSVEGIAGLVQYSGIAPNAGGGLTFTLPSPPVAGAYASHGNVLPACTVAAASAALPVRAASIGNSAGDGYELLIDKTLSDEVTSLFPKMRGVVSIQDTSSNTWFIMYDKVDYDNDKLVGLRNCPGKPPLPAGGIAVAAGASVILDRYAMFVSTGTAGSGQYAATETIKRSQSMGFVGMYRGVEGGMDFNDPNDINKITSPLGDHVIANDGGPDDDSLKVTQTSETYSYTTPTTYQQESLATVDWQTDLIDQLNLEEIWNRSNQLLSYDLQVKIKFTQTEDDVTAPHANFPGHYMPGLSFRTHCSTPGVGSSCTYYGMSLMRGIQGTTEHSSGGCGSSYYTEDDDISDSFYTDFGSNSSAAVSECIADFTPTSWNCTPPQDGIPYLVFWQKYVSTGGGGCGGTASPFDWLAYLELTNHTLVPKIRYYEAYTVPNWSSSPYRGLTLPAGWYDGIIPDDPRNSSIFRYDDYNNYAWKLTDKYGVLGMNQVEGATVLGIPQAVTVRDPSTVSPSSLLGRPVANAAYIVAPSNTDQDVKAANNYLIYPKPWVTVMARVIEMQGDFDCDGDDDRVNAIVGYVGSPDQNGASPFDLPKDEKRRAYPRNSPAKWPEDEDYFTMAVWTDYTSKTMTRPAGCGGTVYIKQVEKGQDSEGSNVVVYSGTFTTENYDFTSNMEEAEFGLHTLGINANPLLAESERETCYFDDLYWAFWEGGVTSMLPGIQQQ